MTKLRWLQLQVLFKRRFFGYKTANSVNNILITDMTLKIAKERSLLFKIHKKVYDPSERYKMLLFNSKQALSESAAYLMKSDCTWISAKREEFQKSVNDSTKSSNTSNNQKSPPIETKSPSSDATLRKIIKDIETASSLRLSPANGLHSNTSIDDMGNT